MKRIAFVTDIHLNEQLPIDHGVDPKRNWERILEDIRERNIKDIVFGGDIGEPSSHQWFFESLGPLNLKLILGNHDSFQQVSKYYNRDNDPNELYYQFEDADHKFLFMDTSSERISPKQMKWLGPELLTHKTILLFVHHPILEVQTPIDQLHPLKNRAELKLLLKSKGNKIFIFCGHYHMNDESTEDNITQTITQSASFQLVKSAEGIEIDNTNFGYRILEVDTDIVKNLVVNFKTVLNN